MTEQILTPPAPASHRGQLISGTLYLVLAILAIGVVLPQFLGSDRDRLAPLLQTARPELLALALALETLRYIGFGLVVRQIAKLLGRTIPPADTAQMMLASYALSRIFSLGGAMAFIVRMQFFLRHGLSAGRTLALFITHNVLSGAALFVTYLVGVSVLWSRSELEGARLWLALGWTVVVIGAAAVQIALGLYPGLPERIFQRVLGVVQARAPFLVRHAIALGGLTSLALCAGGVVAYFQSASGWTQVAALVWAAVFLVVTGMHGLIARNERIHRILRVALARRLPMVLRSGWFHPDASRQFAGELAAGTRASFGQPGGLARAFVFQAGGLAADVVTLIVVAQALQIPMSAPLIVAAYIIAYYAQLIAPTPGEAGAMEFALLGVLAGLGLPALQAAALTLLFRFISFWLPIPVGVICYFNLKRQGKI
ncbi:MAG: flippase-like domain-containing protein [Chloroflexi bacterium]|nr:flippase-like domain-containing protein [Chloroflexota bacterium]